MFNEFIDELGDIGYSWAKLASLGSEALKRKGKETIREVAKAVKNRGTMVRGPSHAENIAKYAPGPSKGTSVLKRQSGTKVMPHGPNGTSVATKVQPAALNPGVSGTATRHVAPKTTPKVQPRGTQAYRRPAGQPGGTSVGAVPSPAAKAAPAAGAAPSAPASTEDKIKDRMRKLWASKHRNAALAGAAGVAGGAALAA